MEVGDGRRTTHNIAGNFQSIIESRRRSETESTNGGCIAAHNDDLATVLKGMAAPVPHVEGVSGVVGLARAVHLDVPGVPREVVLEALVQLHGVAGARQQLVEELHVGGVLVTAVACRL